MTEDGKKYTDLVYATKDDVKAILNRENVDAEWQRVLSYRQAFSLETELRDRDFHPCVLTLTPTILSQCYGLEERLFQDLRLYHGLRRKDGFRLKRKVFALKALSRHCMDKMPNDATLEKIARLEVETLPSSFFLLGSYSRLWEQEDLAFDEALFPRLNALLQGDSTLEAAILRKDVVKDVLNPLLPCPAEGISEQLSFLFLFLRQQEVPLLSRAVLAVYFFLSERPFEYVNEETAALACKFFLLASGLDQVGFALDFESVLFSHSETFFRRLKETERTLDLTYALTSILPYLAKDEEKIRQLLEECRKEEAEQDAATPTEEASLPSVEELALPNFGRREDGRIVEERAKRLRETYPSLKKREAHFYAGHCRIGAFYTIEDFVTSEMSVYETGRQGMEGLAKKGFYRKERQGKKFVYTPIPIEGLD